MIRLKFLGKEISSFKCDEFHISRGNFVWVDDEKWDDLKKSEYKNEFEVIEEKRGNLPEVKTVNPFNHFISKEE